MADINPTIVVVIRISATVNPSFFKSKHLSIYNLILSYYKRVNNLEL
jgi:hypothetical protein